MKVLDLCCGLGGATQAFKDRGHWVIGVDNDPNFKLSFPSFEWDVRRIPIPNIVDRCSGGVDFIWASPPCTEFARESMPWCRTGKIPDMDIVWACINIIETLKPRYWVIENVRGSSKYISPLLGTPKRIGPYYLWGVYPIFDVFLKNRKKKESFSSTQKAERGKIPYAISLALCQAIERELECHLKE